MNTRSAFAVIRRSHENASIDREVKRIIDRLFDLPINRQRAITKVARRFLIQNNTLMIRGILYSTHSKSIGAGVHEIYLKET